MSYDSSESVTASFQSSTAEMEVVTLGDAIEISIVMPCLNESETVGACVGKARAALCAAGIKGEVIVADNGSTDASVQIAEGAGAKVVHVEERGYGSALRGGIIAAKAGFVLIADSDDSYDFLHIPRFLERLRGGADLVMGNRFLGGIETGAMPLLHRYLGNPVLTALGRLFFRSSCGDFHCGIRAFRKDSFERMDIRSTGMEFASEMVVKASLLNMKVEEVPTTLSPDGRSHPPHLRTWHDGWRHLRFLLMYSPRWLFLYPGLGAFVFGSAACLWLLVGPRRIGEVTLDVDTMFYGFGLMLVGFQLVWFAVFTKVFAVTEGLLPEDLRLNRFCEFVKLEAGLLLGASILVSGFAGTIWAFFTWAQNHFGPMNTKALLRIVMPSVLALTLGAQVIFSSFFVSILGLRRRSK